jgi:hypothetical protein
MIIDKRLEFCVNTTVTATANTTVTIGDQADLAENPLNALGYQQVDVGNSDAALLLVITVGSVGINAAAAGNVSFQLTSADDAALTTNPTTKLQTGSFATSTTSGNAGGALAPNTVLFVSRLPTADYRRFLGIRQFTGTQNITAGNVRAFLVHDAPRWKAYQDAVTQKV